MNQSSDDISRIFQISQDNQKGQVEKIEIEAIGRSPSSTIDDIDMDSLIEQMSPGYIQFAKTAETPNEVLSSSINNSIQMESITPIPVPVSTDVNKPVPVSTDVNKPAPVSYIDINVSAPNLSPISVENKPEEKSTEIKIEDKKSTEVSTGKDSILSKYKKKKFDPNEIITDPLSDMLRLGEYNTKKQNRRALCTSKFVAPISGYSGVIGALTLSEKIEFASNLEDPISRVEYIHQTIYNKIISLSVGSLSYQEWLQNTAFADLNTILYSLYEATFPDVQKFDLRCANCNVKNILPLKSEELIKITESNSYINNSIKMLEETSTTFHSKEEVLNLYTNSKVKNPDIYELPNSKYNFTINFINIADSITSEREIVRLMKTKGKNKKEEVLRFTYNLADTIKTLFVPGIKGGYFKISDIETKFDEIEYLSTEYPEDFTILLNIIKSELRDNRITFQTPKFRCCNCGTENANFELNFEHVIFLQIQKILNLND